LRCGSDQDLVERHAVRSGDREGDDLGDVVLLNGPSVRLGRTLVRLLGTVVCVEKLTFRFEDEEGAVILDGWAYRPGCPRLPASLPARPRLVPDRRRGCERTLCARMSYVRASVPS
jgi:hypothetical protein